MRVRPQPQRLHSHWPAGTHSVRASDHLPPIAQSDHIDNFQFPHCKFNGNVLKSRVFGMRREGY